MAAAQQLNRKGHSVTLFEKENGLGGLLRYGIPNFKLNKYVIDRRLAQLEEEGIIFKPNTEVWMRHITLIIQPKKSTCKCKRFLILPCR